MSMQRVSQHGSMSGCERAKPAIKDHAVSARIVPLRGEHAGRLLHHGSVVFAYLRLLDACLTFEDVHVVAQGDDFSCADGECSDYYEHEERRDEREYTPRTMIFARASRFSTSWSSSSVVIGSCFRVELGVSRHLTSQQANIATSCRGCRPKQRRASPPCSSVRDQSVTTAIATAAYPQVSARPHTARRRTGCTT